MRFPGPSSPIVEGGGRSQVQVEPLPGCCEIGSTVWRPGAWARRHHTAEWMLSFFFIGRRLLACCNHSTTQPLTRRVRPVCPGHFQSSNVFPGRTHVCNVHMDTYIQDTTGRKAWLHNSVWGLFPGLRNLPPTPVVAAAAAAAAAQDAVRGKEDLSPGFCRIARFVAPLPPQHMTYTVFAGKAVRPGLGGRCLHRPP
jgi:hypothetical protein